MSVWYCIPSARPAIEARRALDKWRASGYKLALWRDGPSGAEAYCDLLLTGVGEYPGYAAAVNALSQNVLSFDRDCDWIVTGGDDTEPDPDHDPDVIAKECTEHFRGTFGVMQPTGDRWANGSIDKIAGSPWLGREWCERANAGAGPFWPEFTHMFSDQCLQETAIRCRAFWQRPDLTHMHRHFMRNGEEVQRVAPPAHLAKWNTTAHWKEMEAIYLRLKREGFAPCMPAKVCA